MKNSYTRNYSSGSHLLNHESTPAHSPGESWHNHQFQSHLNNGGSYFIDDIIEPDHRYQTSRPQLPPLQPIQTAQTLNHAPHRQIPTLIRANASSSQRNSNGSASLFNRHKLSNVPELYPIQQSVNSYNDDHHYFQQTSSTQRPRPSNSSAAINCVNQTNHVNNRAPPTYNNMSANRSHCGGNSLSLKQNVDFHLKENVSEN